MSTEQKPGAFVSERHQNPGMISTQSAKHEDFTWAAVVACLSTVIFIVLIAMQWMDLQALSLA